MGVVHICLYIYIPPTMENQTGKSMEYKSGTGEI